MGIFRILFYFYLIIYIININEISCSFSSGEHINKQKQKEKHNTNRILKNTLCNVNNCLLCDKINECTKCKEGYELYKKRCYNTNCEIFGFCKFCDEYDCLKCLKGYKLNYGVCEEKVHSTQKIILITLFPIIVICLIIYLCYMYHKKAKEKIKTGQILKFIHPKPGYYQLNFEVNNLDNMNNQETSQNKSLGSTTSETTGERETPIINCCVICGNKKTYTIADCGCSICEQHFKLIKSDKEKIKCRIHKMNISCSMSFQMVVKSELKGNAVEKLGLLKCPICKINDGTQSFNCGCPIRVCENCFNDNVYVFKYNQCPGCGQPYNSIKKVKKRKKSSNDEHLK